MQLTYEQLKTCIGENQNFFVIAGCARSGTMFISQTFRKVGIDVGHWMQIGNHGVASDIVAPFACLYAGRVLHQVRDPIHQIASMQTANPSTWEYIDHVIGVADDSKLLRCMNYWDKWNDIAEGFADLTYRIEDIDRAWPGMLQMIGRPAVDRPVLPTTINSRKAHYVPVTWDMLDDTNLELSRRIAWRAHRYGYRTPGVLQRYES